MHTFIINHPALCRYIRHQSMCKHIHHLSLCKHIHYWPSVTVWAHSQSIICHCANTSTNSHNYVTVQTHPPTTIKLWHCANTSTNNHNYVTVQTHSTSITGHWVNTFTITCLNPFIINHPSLCEHIHHQPSANVQTQSSSTFNHCVNTFTINYLSLC